MLNILLTYQKNVLFVVTAACYFICK